MATARPDGRLVDRGLLDAGWRALRQGAHPQNRLRRGEPLLRAGFPPFERSLERSEAARILGRRRLSDRPARFRRLGSAPPRAKHARIHAGTRAILRTEL